MLFKPIITTFVYSTFMSTKVVKYVIHRFCRIFTVAFNSGSWHLLCPGLILPPVLTASCEKPPHHHQDQTYQISEQ